MRGVCYYNGVKPATARWGPVISCLWVLVAVGNTDSSVALYGEAVVSVLCSRILLGIRMPMLPLGLSAGI